jgi:hypothetical protein
MMQVKNKLDGLVYREAYDRVHDQVCLTVLERMLDLMHYRAYNKVHGQAIRSIPHMQENREDRHEAG